MLLTSGLWPLSSGAWPLPLSPSSLSRGQNRRERPHPLSPCSRGRNRWGGQDLIFFLPRMTSPGKWRSVILSFPQATSLGKWDLIFPFPREQSPGKLRPFNSSFPAGRTPGYVRTSSSHLPWVQSQDKLRSLSSSIRKMNARTLSCSYRSFLTQGAGSFLPGLWPLAFGPWPHSPWPLVPWLLFPGP